MGRWGDPPPTPIHGHKRRRESSIEDRPLAITCTPCRARKIKCDSTKPTCDNCAKNPAECVYPIKLKPGLRPGTGTDMTKRIEALEERVAEQAARLAEHEARFASLSQAQAQVQPKPAAASGSAAAPGPSVSPSTSQWLSAGELLTPLPFAGATPIISPDMPLDLGFGGTSPGAGSTTSFLDPHLLPPDDIVRDLIALYFSHIAPWAPILRPATYAPPWPITVYAIVVVTLRLSSDPRLTSSRQQYWRAAKSHVLSHAIESTSIASVQALALLALDLIGSEQGPSSWGILALLTRSAVHLGLISEDERRAPAHSLSRTSIIPPPADWGEDESRRRLFWLIFCLDRYACVSTGWDFALPDFEIKRRLPCADELWAGSEWHTTPLYTPVLHRDAPPNPAQLSPMAYLVEALDLLGRAHTLQTRTVEPSDAREVEHRKDMTMTLTSAARRWFSDLPPLEAGSMSLVIQAIYHATLLKLNAYYAYPALGTGTPPQPFGDTCMASAHALAHLCSAARDLGWRKASSPLFIWSTWVAARVLFVHDFVAHRDAPCAEFEEILAALKEQAPYWSLANQYTKLLERAKRKWAAGSAYDAEANPSLPDAIHVLLDLRRTAYSAVGAKGEATPYVSPPDVSLSHLPAWAVQPLLGDLHNWFDLPAGLFTEGG
ncbi:hypothetical protein CC85DRAFT_92279 [Cutaneotrichosporon oleaginosum]|uniref:Zn(2)-C6 fungal-type domain-containing protein n=1 Tax=Cutaneotrichosporon oleaginosum TaxID=879819 RepID=A0A0J0XMF8_9TREE|nr:uncharacterized protein CC85DRAFT_92279 [Cutaneotrichosporon oleaginosum]KLT42330.1 hypothetical protein CC85DRAFT_92279 [Cutaneotrichosporon oleaginosum]TXT04150.1 hypothetical protein COLE_07847 [Cutaneotrichosporon oleaginosum]